MSGLPFIHEYKEFLFELPQSCFKTFSSDLLFTCPTGLHSNTAVFINFQAAAVTYLISQTMRVIIDAF